MKRKRKPERFAMRVSKGALVPADRFTAERLREKGYRVGDIVSVQIFKARESWHNRKAHLLGRLLSENLDEFEGMDAHAVLKRIQWEANVACDEMVMNVPGVGGVVVRIPDSFSFDSMDQGEFEAAYRGLCKHVVKQYWPGLDEFAIEQMGELMEGAA